jgi:hypothetical protein
MTLAELGVYVVGRCRRDDACLLWPGAVNTGGRPVFRMACCGTRDPRVVLWTASGRKLKHGHVFSKPSCGEMRCLEPAHQRYMLRTEAIQHAARLGLLSSGLRHSAAIRAGQIRRGKGPKVPEQTVQAMRARYAETANAALVAREFGVHHSYAHRIVKNQARRITTPFDGLRP